MDTCNKSIEDLSESSQKSLKKLIEKEGFKSYDITIKPINTKGANFLCEIFQIDIKDDSNVINIFMKQKKDFEKVILLSPPILYQKEAWFYNDLSEIYNILQSEANVAPEDRFKLVKAYSETSPDAIFLENLSKKGFKILNRTETLPLKCVEMAVVEIAKFHSLSFVIENKMPDYHLKNIKVLNNPIRCDEDYEVYMRNVFTYIGGICDETTKAKVEKFMPVFFEKYPMYKDDKTSIKCALSHGDFRSTNILVRQHGGEPQEIIIVDYQFIDYGCPLRDLFLILIANTDQATRRNHMNHLKELYYNTLSSFLKYFNMDVETVYPRSEFDRVFSEWFIYGLMITLLYLPFLFAPDTGIEYSSDKLSDVPLNLDENTKKKVRELLQDFIYWGYL